MQMRAKRRLIFPALGDCADAFGAVFDGNRIEQAPRFRRGGPGDRFDSRLKRFDMIGIDHDMCDDDDH